jgi:fido (protein-threonine AMPylation protein)
MSPLSPPKKRKYLNRRIKNINTSQNSIDTKCKVYNEVANELSRDNSAYALKLASNLYEQVWKWQCEQRGSSHSRSMTAYLNYNNIQDRVKKAKAGQVKTRALNKARLELIKDAKKSKKNNDVNKTM